MSHSMESQRVGHSSTRHLRTRRRAPRQDREYIAARAAVVVLVIGAPQLLGGVFAWATAAICLMSTLALLLLVQAASSAPSRQTSVFEPMTALLFLALLAASLQTLPLPRALSEWLAVDALERSQATFEALSLAAPRFVAFSLDPGNGYERALFAAAVLASFIVARFLVVRRGGTEVLVQVAISVLAVALSQLGHELLYTTRIYGVYEPMLPGPSGPLINPNNRAGYMALGLPICLGLALRRSGLSRALWSIAFAVIAATGFLASSRAGVVALLLGPLLFLVMRQLRARESGRGVSSSGLLGWSAVIMLAVALLSLAYLLASLAREDFLETNYGDLSKLHFFEEQLALLRGSLPRLLFGYGRGAFSAAFAGVSDFHERALYSECLPLQYLIEFGVPTGSILLVGAALRFGAQLWRWRGDAQLGGIVGLLALAVHNLADFSLELSGVAVPAALCLGASMPTWPSSAPRLLRWLEVERSVRWGSFVSLLVCAVYAWPAVRVDLLPAERDLERDFRARDSEAFWSRVSKVMEFHPGEPSLASLAAAASVSEGSPRAAVWLGRAMVLAPGWPGPHVWAARWLASLRRWSQAAGELRMAAERGSLDADIVLCELLSEVQSSAFVLDSSPDHGPGRQTMLAAGARCLSKSPVEAEQVDALILSEQPRDVAAVLRRAQRAGLAGDWLSARSQAAAVRIQHADLTEPYLIESAALRAMGEVREALDVLRDGVARADKKPQLLEALAVALAERRDEEGMRGAIQELKGLAGGQAAQLAAISLLLGRLEASLGNSGRAIKAVREACDLGAGRDSLAESARLASQLGHTRFALQLWERLCDAQHSNSAYCAERNRLRAQLEAVR